MYIYCGDIFATQALSISIIIYLSVHFVVAPIVFSIHPVYAQDVSLCLCQYKWKYAFRVSCQKGPICHA